MRKKKLPKFYSGTTPEEVDFTYDVKRKLIPYYMNGLVTQREMDIYARRKLVSKKCGM